jgi:tripartite-type tricarboxylate transporter receptor subunit TctC
MNDIRIGRRAALLGAAGLPLLARPARAAFPDRPMTLIMPDAPGTVASAYARVIAEQMQARFGQPMAVTHRDGASGTVGMRALANSPADGHSIAITPLTPVVVMPHLIRNLGLGPASFSVVCGVAENILGVVVRADSPIRSVPQLVEAGRRRMLNFGSPGPNSLPQLGMYRVTRATGVEFNHIPFRGDAAPITEILAGRLDFAANVVASSTAAIEAGEVRLIGVFSDRRHPGYPDVPTVAEQGIDAVQLSYVGCFAPAGTPDAALDQLQGAMRETMATDAFLTVARRGRVVVDFQPRDRFAALVTREHAAFGAVLRDLGVQPE